MMIKQKFFKQNFEIMQELYAGFPIMPNFILNDEFWSKLCQMHYIMLDLMHCRKHNTGPTPEGARGPWPTETAQ